MAFSENQLYLILDYETFSEIDIKKVGSYEYSNHPSTEILCASFRLGTRKTLPTAKVHTYAPKKFWNEHRDDLRKGKLLGEYILNKDVVIVAHNAMFEQAVTRFVLPGQKRPLIIPHKRFLCTAALASVFALPRKLEGACQALQLDHQKDAEGHRLMLKWSKPRKPTKNNSDKRHSDPTEFDRLILYCERDIYAETDLFLALPPMIDSERDLWVFDQVINFRGAYVDRPLVKKIIGMIKEEKDNMTEELQQLTNGVVKTGGQGAVIQKWLETNDVFLPNLQKKTVEDAIKDGLVDGQVKRVLELRQNLNKTSLKKYPTFLNHTTTDSVMRFSLNFHAASPGRWGGAGVQPHNFPRGTLKNAEGDLAPAAAEAINDGADLEMVRLLYGEPMEVFVSCLRTMIKAREGKELFVADFAAIEARILFWVADHYEGCKAYREGRKMYEEMAMDIFNITDIFKVTKDQRFVGKQTVLGSGYGMGFKKFQSSCQDLGQEVSTEVSKKAITSYREKHKPVPNLWKNLEKAAIAAVNNPTKTFKINHTEWFMKGKFLYCRLPSGRCLHYYGPHIKHERTPWGDSRATLRHWGVDPKTKKWVVEHTWGGKLTENVVQAISRDLLAAAMLRIEKAGWKVLLTVHDEIIAEREVGQGDLEEFNGLMKKLPDWAKGAPVDCEGWYGQRYHK